VSTSTATFIVALTSFSADIVQVLLGIAAFVIGLTQRKKISAAFSLLLSYSLRTSLSDLNHLIEKLNEHSIEDPPNPRAVRVTLARIHGKIRGNEILQKHMGTKVLKPIKIMIDELDAGRTVNETDKISLCTELKERLTTLEIENHTSKQQK